MQRRWQLLGLADYVRAALLEPAATPACSWARGAEWGAFVEGKSTVPPESKESQGNERAFLHKCCPVPSCPASPCTHPSCWMLSWVWLMAEHHSGHREGKRKQRAHNIQWTNPRATDLRPVHILILQGIKWTAPLQVQLKCVQGSALMLIHFHQKASQCWCQDINYVNHYLASFSQKPMNSLCIFFKTSCIKWAMIK